MDNDETSSIISGFAGGKAEFSKPLLVMLALKDVREKRAVEMKEGYFNETTDVDKKRVRTWIGDSRKIFFSSVEALRTLLAPEIKDDKKFKEIYDNIKEKEKEIFNVYAYKEKVFRSDKQVKETGEIIMPQIDGFVLLFDSKCKRYMPVKGGWNLNVNAYYDSLIHHYDSLVEELNLLIDRLGYFKKKQRFG